MTARLKIPQLVLSTRRTCAEVADDPMHRLIAKHAPMSHVRDLLRRFMSRSKSV